MDQEEARGAVVRVGDGRGFIVDAGDQRRLIITAAHCLPCLPIGFSIAYTQEVTYPNLIGPLDDEPTICAECLFVDPVADIGVLGSPDNQQLNDEALAYDALVDDAPALKFGGCKKGATGWLLSLSGEWFNCVLNGLEHGPFRPDTPRSIEAGMSGSPIIDDRCVAVGLVATGSGPDPRLTAHLPGWMLRACV